MRKKQAIGLALIFLGVFAFVVIAHAASLGPNSPGTAADDSTVGSLTWVNPNNSKISDNIYSTVNSTGGSTITTHYLKTTNYGFSVPIGATINGITVLIERKGTTNGGAGNFVKDSAVRIVKSDGSIGTTNKADTTTQWPLTDTNASYGNSSDLWGESWTPSDINNANFGVVLSAALTPPDTTQTASIDYMSITITYTLPSGPHVQVTQSSGTTIISSGTVIIP